MNTKETTQRAIYRMMTNEQKLQHQESIVIRAKHLLVEGWSKFEALEQLNQEFGLSKDMLAKILRANNIYSMTHKERHNRRNTVAMDAKELIVQGKTHAEIYSVLSQKYLVTRNFIKYIISQLDMSDLAAANRQQNVRDTIRDLLQDSTLTLRDIASKVGVTHQRVHQIHKELLQAGEDVPVIEEVLDRRRIVREAKYLEQGKVFLEHLQAHGDFTTATQVAGISRSRARMICKDNDIGLDGKSKVRRDCKSLSQRLSGQFLYIIADIINTNASIVSIAEKYNRPSPYITNLIAECRAAGIALPERTDARKHPRVRCETTGKLIPRNDIAELQKQQDVEQQ